MNQQPSVFASRRSRDLAGAATAEIGGIAHPRLSIKANRFTRVDAAGMKYPWPHLYIDVVFIDFNRHVSKIYFEGAFDPSAVEFPPPTCFSDNGVAPSRNSAKPQSRTCAECPHNVWGSDENELTGAQRKACNDKKKAAVFIVNDDTQLAYELQIPPKSLKALRVYSNMIKTYDTPDKSRKADLDDVVTRVTFVADKNGELEFAAVGWISMIQPDGRMLYDRNAQGQVFPLTSPDGGMAFAQRVDEAIDEDEQGEPQGITSTIVGRRDQPWQGPLQVTQGQSAQPLAALQHTPGLQQGAPAPAQPQQQIPAPTPPPTSRRGGARQGAGRPKTVVQSPQAAFREELTQQAPSPANVVPMARQPAQPDFLQTPAPPAAAAPPQQEIIPPGQPLPVGDCMGIPDFLKRQADPAAQPTGFGMQNPAPVTDKALDDALATAFSLNTNR
jgi:hypothetical protein